MKKIFLVILILFLNGCSQYTELNNLAIIKSIGINYQDEYILYAQIIEEMDKDNLPKTKIVEVQGKDIPTLFLKIKKEVNKEIYLSHLDLLIIDQHLAEKQYQELITYFLKHQELRNDFFCILGEDIHYLLKNTKYDEIEKIILTNQDVIKISFQEIMENLLNKQDFKISSIRYQDELIIKGNFQYQQNKLKEIQ